MQFLLNDLFTRLLKKKKKKLKGRMVEKKKPEKVNLKGEGSGLGECSPNLST